MVKMNILITSIIDLEKTPNSRLHHFIGHFLEKGHKVTVVSIKDFWKETKKDTDLTSRIDVRYVTGRKMGPVRQKLYAFFNIGKIMRGISLDSVDVHLSYNSLVLGWLIGKRLERLGIRTVYDLADDLPELIASSPYIPRVLRKGAGIFGKRMLKKNLALAREVIISANEFRRTLGVKRATLIPNGVDVKRFIPKKDKHDGLVVGYLGALREWVDLRPMLVAVKRLSGLRVVIVGGEESLPVYKRFVDRIGISERVVFTGNVPFKEVPSHIAGFDIGTIPFRKNNVTDGTCPLKLLEYMAMGKPAICSSLNEIRSMVGERVLYADTVDEWMTAIKALGDKGYRERLGREGRQYVVENYDWEDLCGRVLEILENSKRL